MKKPAMILILTGLLWACNSSSSPGSETPAEPGGHTHAHEAALALNNGQKWKADAATNENVTAIRTIVQNFSGEPHASQSDYGILASDLQKELNRMIRECKMSGPDHDVLHLWLEPLLGDVNELKQTNDITSAQKIVHAIDKRLSLYTQYFE